MSSFSMPSTNSFFAVCSFITTAVTRSLMVSPDTVTSVPPATVPTVPSLSLRLPTATRKKFSSSSRTMARVIAVLLSDNRPGIPPRRMSFSSASSMISLSMSMSIGTCIPLMDFPFPAALAVPYSSVLADANLFATSVPACGSPESLWFLKRLEIVRLPTFSMMPFCSSARSILPSSVPDKSLRFVMFNESIAIK